MTDLREVDVKALETKHRAALERWATVKSQTNDKGVIERARKAAEDVGSEWATAAQTLERQKKGSTPNTGAAKSLFGGLFGS